MKITILSGAITAALLSSNLVFAQDAETQAPTETEEVQQESDAKLERIIVTSQRREQSIQDVPFSVTALSGEALKEKGVFDVIDLQSVTPSLMMPSTGSPAQGASFRLRGFGSPPFQLGIEPAVPLFMDGVYRSRSGVAVNDLVDVARIEVLKGPQGTLFGKNTTAGLIHIITNKPNTDDVEGFAEVSYEKYDRKRVKGMINLPVGDTVAVRVSGTVAEGDGWLNNPTEDMHNLDRSNIHAQLLYKPSDTFDVNLSVSYGEMDENCCATVTPETAEDLENNDSTLSNTKSEDLVYSAEINWQLSDDITLTSVTSYQDFENDGVTDGEFTDFPLLDIVENVTIEGVTQELRLTGVSDSMHWTAGAFYSDDEINRIRDFVWLPGIAFLGGTPGLGNHDVLFQNGTSYAVFAQSTFEVSEKLSITAGARFNHEEKDGGGDLEQPNLNFLRPTYASYRDEIEEDEVTGTLSAQYKLSNTLMAYATYSHGYKAGGINLAREAAGFPELVLPPEFGGGMPEEPAPGPFDAETVDSFELGVKSDLFNDRLRLNAAIFYSDYQDQQNSVLVGQNFQVVNGEGAEVTGLEIEGMFAATENLTLNFGLTALETEFADGTSFDGGMTDVGGDDLSWAPDLAASAGWSYLREIGSNGLEVFWTGSYSYKGEYLASSSAEPSSNEDSSAIVNTRVGLNLDDWSVAVWCRNCTDERVAEVKFNNPLFGDPLQYVNRPIEMGVTVSYEF